VLVLDGEVLARETPETTLAAVRARLGGETAARMPTMALARTETPVVEEVEVL
jgi:hypothetical protein